MENVTINTEYIKLDQMLKWVGIVNSGAEAKELIGTGKVSVNGQIEIQRGKKLRKGDTLEYNGKKFTIV